MSETQLGNWQPIETAPKLRIGDKPIMPDPNCFTMLSGDYYAPPPAPAQD